MIERCVFIKLTDQHATDPGRAAVIAHTRDVLATVPGVVSIAVWEPADELSAVAWDLSIRLRFEDIEDVEAYRVHPIHRAYVDEFMAGRIEVLKAWNFDIG